jgi:hypothetical protein
VRQAIIVIGAGASYDSVSENVSSRSELQPPLVTELFDKRFEAILNDYPLAEQLAPDIRIATESGQVVLEAFLRDELLNSEYEHFRRRYHAIPLYLQHLLFEVSQRYTPQPDNYDRLILEALRLDKVTFITLNYDTLLDQRLAIDAPIERMVDYVRAGRKWALVKLHGSVNWGQRIFRIPDGPPTKPPVELAAEAARRTFASYYARLGETIDVDPVIELRTGDSLEELRVEWEEPDYPYADREGDLYYPSLAVPLGEADTMVCPDDHAQHVRDHQSQAPGGLNVLVIGYSGLDQEVRKLLSWGGRSLSSLLVVNGSLEQSTAAAEVLARELGVEPGPDMAFAGGFNDFAQTDAISEWFRSLPDTGN